MEDLYDDFQEIVDVEMNVSLIGLMTEHTDDIEFYVKWYDHTRPEPYQIHTVTGEQYFLYHHQLN